MEFLSFSLSLKGVPNLTIRSAQQPGYLLQPGRSDAIDVFDKSALLELRRAAHLQLVFKTSFSRSNPVPRGQATVIRSRVRGNPKDTNNQRSRVTSFLPTSGSSFVSGRLDHPRHHWNRLRTLQAFAQNTWKPPDQSSLHNFAEQAPGISPGANLFFFKGYLHRHLDTKLYWWS